MATKIKNYVVPVGVEPFEGDLFEREALAARLTKSIGLIGDGGAIAIDGNWGSGKSWFAKNWKLHLESADVGRTAVYIDAFAMDYVDDPFLMIAGELIEVARRIKPKKAQSLLEVSGRLGKVILPVGARVLAGAAAKWAVGNDAASDVAETLDGAIDSAGSLVEKQIEKKLSDYEVEKVSVREFKAVLTELTADLANPIVVFVDELDRCKPDFAVRTLERIKHFFEVPGLTFVLMINRSQLVASIQGAYGNQLDGDSYLRKFLLFSLQLPKGGPNDPSFTQQYVGASLSAFGFPDKEAHTVFAQTFGIFAARMDLELRDIERAVALYALAQPINNLSGLAAWLIAVKFWQPDLFKRLLTGDYLAHTEIVVAANSRPGGVRDSGIVPVALDLHRCYGSRFNEKVSPNTGKFLTSVAPSLPVERVFPFLLARIDLAVV